MGSKFSSLCSPKTKSKKSKQIQYSPRTAQKMYNARRSSKLIYPPLSALLKDEPKRSLRPDGRLLYEPVRMNSSFDDNNHQYESPHHCISSNFPNNYQQYDDGTFAVLSRYPNRDGNVFRI